MGDSQEERFLSILWSWNRFELDFGKVLGRLEAIDSNIITWMNCTEIIILIIFCVLHRPNKFEFHLSVCCGAIDLSIKHKVN